MSERVICNLCDRPLVKHESYVVRMDVFAHPASPPINTDELAEPGFDETLDQLLADMNQMTADDLQDGVHRRFEYALCPACHRQFLANPLGKPRSARAGEN